MSEQKTEQKPADHKAIREALEASEREWRVSCFVVGSDLRALLADLDAMRGALEHCEGVFMAPTLPRAPVSTKGAHQLARLTNQLVVVEDAN